MKKSTWILVILFLFIGVIFSKPSASDINLIKSRYSDSIETIIQNEIYSIETVIKGLNQRDFELKVSEENYFTDSVTNLNGLFDLDSLITTYQNKYYYYLNYISENSPKKLTDLDSLFRKARFSLNSLDSSEKKKETLKIVELKRIHRRPEIDQIPNKRQKIQDSIIEISEPTASQISKLKTGAYSFKFSKKIFRIFIVDSTRETQFIYNSKKSPISIDDIIQKEKRIPEMVTNAGMFEPNYETVGLFIENGIEKKGIDTITNKKGNFYLLPNGIFFVDNAGKFHILDTKDFIRNPLLNTMQKGKHPKIQYATQSGPLLLYRNEYNKNLKFSSYNENIRSGVGIINDGKCVFIKTDDQVNFFDFAQIFKVYFRCESALYLDGAISKMYFSDDYTKKNFLNNDHGGSFGPMIAIYKK